MVAGLGIDFNPPPTPSLAQHPASSRAHPVPAERGHSDDATPSVQDAELSPAIVGRRVRIVSAANVYHEQSPGLSLGGSDVAHAELDGYTTTDAQEGPASRGSCGQDSDVYSPMSTAAVSSGSPTRHEEVGNMQQARTLASAKAEDFEASLRRQVVQRIPAPPHPRMVAHGPAPTKAMHMRSYSEDIHPLQPPAQRPAIRHQASQPKLNAGSRQLPSKPSLKRTSALSRPKSMMELSQLYAQHSLQPFDIPNRAQEASHFQAEQAARMPSPATTSPVSSYDGSSSENGHVSTAPSSMADSSELKSAPRFAFKHTDPYHSAVPHSHHLTKARSTTSLQSAASSSSVVSSFAQEARRQQLRARADSMTTSSSMSWNGSSTLQTASAAKAQLQRNSTLLSTNTSPSKRARDLNRLLAPKAAGVKPGTKILEYEPAVVPSSPGGTPIEAAQMVGGTSGYQPGLKRKSSTVVLEQATKSKSRVEMDLLLTSAVVVEGGTLRGRMEVKVRPEKAGESEVWLGAVKARIVGFEELAGEEARHVFYHHSIEINQVDGRPLPCYASQADGEGFSRGSVGNHAFPFSMHLPMGRGAKGSFSGKQGVVKYIVIGSVKLKSKTGGDRSIAHFYRNIDVFPYLSPAAVLKPSPLPISAEACNSVFMGGSGKIKLSARLHRSSWVAGTRCYVEVSVLNETSKKIKSLNLSLIRTLKVYRPRFSPTSSHGPGAGENLAEAAFSIASVTKKIAESSLEMGKKSTRGNVTAKGTWMGVEKGEHAEFCHSLQIPEDALSIARGRYLEVFYTLKVSVGSPLSSDVAVELPLDVVNFISLDPPPGHVIDGGRVAGPAVPSKIESPSIDPSPPVAVSQPGEAAEGNDIGRAMLQEDEEGETDALEVEDLNQSYHRPACHVSPGIGHSSFAQAYPTMTRSHTAPILAPPDDAHRNPDLYALPAQAQRLIEKAKQRQLKHQMSLDCIGSALGSAAAHRNHADGQMLRGNSTHSEEICEDSAAPTEATLYDDEQASNIYDQYYDDVVDVEEQEGAHSAIRLEDLEDIPDDGDDDQMTVYRSHPISPQATEYEDESEDEVDTVLRARHINPLDAAYDDYLPQSIASMNRHAPPPMRDNRRKGLASSGNSSGRSPSRSTLSPQPPYSSIPLEQRLESAQTRNNLGQRQWQKQALSKPSGPVGSAIRPNAVRSRVDALESTSRAFPNMPSSSPGVRRH